MKFSYVMSVANYALYSALYNAPRWSLIVIIIERGEEKDNEGRPLSRLPQGGEAQTTLK